MGERRDGTEYSGRREGGQSLEGRGGEGIQQAWAGGRTDEGRGREPTGSCEAGRQAGRKGEGGGWSCARPKKGNIRLRIRLGDSGIGKQQGRLWRTRTRS